MDLSLPQIIAVSILPLLFGITVHEVAHGWVAKQLGDPTAMMLGRLTLNPIKHIDPIGTLLVPGILLILGGFVFGWAKPVPVTYENLRHPRRDMALVAVAGPASNLLMALIWALIAKVGFMLMGPDTNWLAVPLILMGGTGVTFNLVLMVLNMLPIPPLDGGRIVSSLLPPPLAWKYGQIEPFGFIILIALIATQVLGKILAPAVGLFEAGIYKIFGL
ncbi:MAG: site-2 protease family protein [Pseudomonadota bacterium]